MSTSGEILIEKLLETTIRVGANDLHITVGQKPTLRHQGRLRQLETRVLTQDDTMSLMKSITPDRCQHEIQEKGGADFAIEFRDGVRFRVAVFRQRGNLGIVMRITKRKKTKRTTTTTRKRTMTTRKKIVARR